MVITVEKLQTLNSLVRTSMALIVFGAVGVVSWIGFQTYRAADPQLTQVQQALEHEVLFPLRIQKLFLQPVRCSLIRPEFIQVIQDFLGSLILHAQDFAFLLCHGFPEVVEPAFQPVQPFAQSVDTFGHNP